LHVAGGLNVASQRVAFAIFAVFPLLGEAAGPAQAQCTLCAIEWNGGRVTGLGGLPGATYSQAKSINGAGESVGYSVIGGLFGSHYATEWSGGKAIALPGLPGSTYSEANGVNNAGRVVGISLIGVGDSVATEWNGGKATALGGLPGFSISVANGVNNAGQVVGYSESGGIFLHNEATEWSGGKVIDLGGPAGSTDSVADGINDSGQAVGWSVIGFLSSATEWSGGKAKNLGGLPGSVSSEAVSINDSGVAVGNSVADFAHGFVLPPSSGAAARSRTSEVCRAPRSTKPTASTTPGRWWERALSAAWNTQPSGAAAASSIWAN
jgi:probable HAF family extracellular repeat protein